MDSIDLMMREHDHILTFTDVLRIAAMRVMAGESLNISDYRRFIIFARTYADQSHHGKEEAILFREMVDQLGTVGDNLIRHGMLVEHSMGRFHIGELENALDRYETSPNDADKLDIIVHSGAWAELLRRHIFKENNAVYSLARRALTPECLAQIDAEVEVFSRVPETIKAENTALSDLADWTARYLNNAPDEEDR